MDYFSSERKVFCKVKKMVSSLLGFLVCEWSFRSPMQDHPPVVRFSISGLKSLISSSDEQENEDRVVIRSSGVGIIRSNLLLTHSSTSSFFCNSIRSSNLLMDDLIGTESGFCLISNTEEIEPKLTPSDSDFPLNRHDFTEQNHRSTAPIKQFPPPIPFLASQAGNRTRPPWILTRNCSDGRLILKLERVRHHQSLESHRENGRLILNLVPAPVAVEDDDDDQDLQFIEEEEIESIESEEKEEEEEEGTEHEHEIWFKSFTYGGDGGGGGMFCGVNGNFEERGRHVGSAPLRRMGTVM